MNFVTTGASSLLALIVMAVFHYKTTGTIPDHVATAFKRIRLRVYVDATPNDIAMVGQCGNMDQHEHRRHSEIDNILAVDAWMQSMKETAIALNPLNMFDVFRFAVCLVDPRRPSDMPAWMAKELACNLPTIANRIATVMAKHVTKRWLMDNKAAPVHPQLNSYVAVARRHRFLRGFCALRELHQLLYCRMGVQGLAHKQGPISEAGPYIVSGIVFHVRWVFYDVT